MTSSTAAFSTISDSDLRSMFLEATTAPVKPTAHKGLSLENISFAVMVSAFVMFVSEKLNLSDAILQWLPASWASATTHAVLDAIPMFLTVGWVAMLGTALLARHKAMREEA